ncbi:hypothetical protein ACJMK2_044550 [Sinanodonta woodiana]|uniref:Tyrosine-protein kinase receptor n=1 Tax=Sinanodonta woodiana TaxID=1069815 RepID=A0ABD3W413_SINWO
MVMLFNEKVAVVAYEKAVVLQYSKRYFMTSCGNIDIRNKVENFNILQNCTVVEGTLQILLIDYAKPKDYENISFPDLVEITDYLLLYRVYGLKSLRNIFPNLAVIRGEKLFSNYALIAFEMPNLEELGLVKLTTIKRGAVRLEKNPNLCYIETVDWTKIAKQIEASEHFFKNNMDIKQCINTCPANCPLSRDGTRRCWTLEHCQTMLDCPDGCEYCNAGVCCNENCIGGCSGPKETNCTACKHVLDAVRPVCAERCSPGTYKFMNRRCLLDTECLNFTDYGVKSLMLVNSTPNQTQQKECVSECPPKYIPDKNNHSLCVPCQGKCPKVCSGKIIDSINSAQQLKGCTVITGPLEISITGGSSVGQELENNLAEIEVVTHYIRIYRSHALLSLHFLKNLREIQGKEQYTGRYALVVFENSNLQELFTEEVTKNLIFLNGSVWFHYNSKLCLKIIKMLLEPLNLLNKTTDMDVSPSTNGDRMTCQMQVLNLTVLTPLPQIAILQWTLYQTADERQLISYTINFKEAPEQNVAIYQGRDACSSDLWRTVEEKPVIDNERNKSMAAILPNLKSFTQYAVYVQTMTISNAQEGGITPLIYFKTLPDMPSYPVNLKVTSEMTGELRVTWDPPKSPNGNVTHYEVYWQKQDIDASKYDVRDYCTNPLLDTSKGQKGHEDKEDSKQNQTISGCCTCPKTKQELANEEREREMEIKFQDYLQNEVYIKRLEHPASTIQPTRAQITSQIKKSLARMGSPQFDTSDFATLPAEVVNTNLTVEKPFSMASSSTMTTERTSSASSLTESTPSPRNGTIWQPKENPYLKAVVYGKREIYLLNLSHFEDYSIEVIACQERDHVNKHKLCSNRAIITGRTLPDEMADNINMSTVNHIVSANRSGEVVIQWSDPPQPNGLILTYEIEYSRVNIRNIKPNIICIPHKTYRIHGGHTLDKLELGFNYTYRIRATSLAGNGSWTEPMFFALPPEETVTPYIMIIAILVPVLVVIVVLIIGATCWYYKIKLKKLPDTYISTNANYFAGYDVYVPDDWEVDREKVELLRELGQGSFGMVYEGIVCDLNGQEKIRIAVKTVNESATDYERLMFLKEASIMKAFECHHVVRLIGVVSKSQPALVLMELMANDLKNFLRMHRPDEEDNEGRLPPTLKRILLMAGQIADGMAYLADKKYVHRDLAARNCMVAEDLTVKIGDFGMTRDIYETDYYRKGDRGLLPVRWMAPESLKDGVFTSMSDVWSYGVVLWEMATLAAQPYQGLSNEDVLRYVGNGRIMEKPEGCPGKLYDMMLKCWRFRPKQRPTFKEIIEILVPDLDPTFRDVSYFFNEGQLKPDEVQHNDLNDIDDDDGPHLMEEEMDESNLPFLPVMEKSQDQGVELNDLFHDTSYAWQPDHSNVGAEPCDCTLFQERDQACGGIPHDIIIAAHNSNSASSNSAIGAIDGGSSTEGSKDSSKSSSSSYAMMNGLSVANGHLPIQVRTTPC